MAEQAKSLDEPGAPIAKDTVDPELIRLKRSRPKIGVITAAGLVFLCGFFLLRLNPDRRFSTAGAEPSRVAVADVLAGNVALDKFVVLDAEPMASHAIRATNAKGSLGLRVAPVRGSGERLWLALSGDGWEQPAQGGYVGRLRKLDGLPFAPSIEAFAADHARPVFAEPSAVRAGLATGKVATVAGDEAILHDVDRVALDVIDPYAAVIVCAFNEHLGSTAAWSAALANAQITVGAPQATADQVRFEVSQPDPGHQDPAPLVPSLTAKLEAHKLWAARVEPVTRHYETTWGALRGSAPTGFTMGGTTIPDAQLDLIGLYVARAIPSDAYVLLTDERPADYWYVLPVTIALAVIGLVFAWALVRAVKRDLLPTRA